MRANVATFWLFLRSGNPAASISRRKRQIIKFESDVFYFPLRGSRHRRTLRPAPRAAN